ncbi:hypothetical protein LXL04_026952 [Taraxacum kok-saghyz]
MQKFDIVPLVELIQKYKVTMGPFVPPIVLAIVKNEEVVDKYDVTSIQTVMSGAAPLGKELEDTVRMKFPNAKLGQEEADEEMYQERSVLQVEEDEEEDLNRINEESRRRRQAIVEKYKTKSLKQQAPQLLEDTGGSVFLFSSIKSNDSSQINVCVAKVNNGQGELSDSNTGDTPFSVGRSPLQNGVERALGTGGLGEGTPKSERSNGDDIFGDSSPQAQKERRNDMFSDRVPA